MQALRLFFLPLAVLSHLILTVQTGFIPLVACDRLLKLKGCVVFVASLRLKPHVLSSLVPVSSLKAFSIQLWLVITSARLCLLNKHLAGIPQGRASHPTRWPFFSCHLSSVPCNSRPSVPSSLLCVGMAAGTEKGNSSALLRNVFIP